MWPGLGYLENFSWGRGVPPTHISAHLNFKVKFLRERFHHLPKGLKIKEKYFEMWHILGYPVNFFSSILIFFFFLSSFFPLAYGKEMASIPLVGGTRGRRRGTHPRKMFKVARPMPHLGL